MSLPSVTILRARTAAGLLAALALVAAGHCAAGADPGAGPAVRNSGLPEGTPVPLRRLTPRGESSASSGTGRAGLPSTSSVLSALAVITIGIFGAARLWKTHGPKLPAAAPREAIEVLGRCRIENRQSVYLVRLGARVLVLGSSGGELSTLSEITDAVEVDLLTAQCRDGSGGGTPFSRLFESRRKSESESTEGMPAPAENRATRWTRTPVEQRLAERVRGRAGDEGTSHVA